jgi:hypothetical protein
MKKDMLILLAATSLFISFGCSSDPKPKSQHAVVKLPYWEFHTLAFTNFPPPVDASVLNNYPEVQKLKQEGWTCLGWRFANNNGVFYPGEFGAVFAVDFKRPSKYSPSANQLNN